MIDWEDPKPEFNAVEAWLEAIDMLRWWQDEAERLRIAYEALQKRVASVLKRE